MQKELEKVLNQLSALESEHGDKLADDLRRALCGIVDDVRDLSEAVRGL